MLQKSLVPELLIFNLDEILRFYRDILSLKVNEQ